MRVSAKHLPPNTDFDLFVIQVPNAPFGISWYQGDLTTPFNGEHDAGVQALSTQNFPDQAGPLRQVHS